MEKEELKKFIDGLEDEKKTLLKELLSLPKSEQDPDLIDQILQLDVRLKKLENPLPKEIKKEENWIDKLFVFLK